MNIKLTRMAIDALNVTIQHLSECIKYFRLQAILYFGFLKARDLYLYAKMKTQTKYLKPKLSSMDILYPPSEKLTPYILDKEWRKVYYN